MKEAGNGIGLILSLISWVAIRVFEVTWGLIKVAVFLAIVFGALKSLSGTSFPVIGDVVGWAKAANPSFFGAAFLLWVAENWMALALLLVFLNSVSSRRVLGELSKTGGYTRIFIGTVMNYFSVETETPSLKKMRDKGALSVIKQGVTEGVVTRVFGIELADDSLSAKAMRCGEAVCLSDDIKEAVGSGADGKD